MTKHTGGSEPTKKEVLALADYLGCNGEELWLEVRKLLKREYEYALDEVEKQLPKKELPELQEPGIIPVNNEGIETKYIPLVRNTGFNEAVEQQRQALKQLREEG